MNCQKKIFNFNKNMFNKNAVKYSILKLKPVSINNKDKHGMFMFSTSSNRIFLAHVQTLRIVQHIRRVS